MIRLGIIGLGHMGNYHMSVCEASSIITLVAVSDINTQNLSKIKSNKIIKDTNYKNWLNKVDGVIIAVPTEHHFDIAKYCLLSKKHVLIEKPITKDIKLAKELFSLAEKNNLALHVGHVERFNGAVQELKKIVHQPFLIESHRTGPFSSRVQNDSVVLDLMIHDIDLVLNIVKRPVLNASIVSQSIKTTLPDIAIVQIQFDNGCLANITSSRASEIKERTMTIHQKNAFIKLDFTTQDISIHRHTSDSVKIGANQLQYKQESIVERLLVYKDNPLKQEVNFFAKSIKTGKKLRNPKKDIAALELTLNLEQRAIQQNRKIKGDT